MDTAGGEDARHDSATRSDLGGLRAESPAAAPPLTPEGRTGRAVARAAPGRRRGRPARSGAARARRRSVASGRRRPELGRCGHGRCGGPDRCTQQGTARAHAGAPRRGRCQGPRCGRRPVGRPAPSRVGQPALDPPTRTRSARRRSVARRASWQGLVDPAGAHSPRPAVVGQERRVPEMTSVSCSSIRSRAPTNGVRLPSPRSRFWPDYGETHDTNANFADSSQVPPRLTGHSLCLRPRWAELPNRPARTM